MWKQNNYKWQQNNHRLAEKENRMAKRDQRVTNEGNKMTIDRQQNYRMTAKWQGNSSGIIQKWQRNGPKMSTKWQQNVSGMISRRQWRATENSGTGNKMIRTWHQNDERMTDDRCNKIRKDDNRIRTRWERTHDKIRREWAILTLHSLLGSRYRNLSHKENRMSSPDIPQFAELAILRILRFALTNRRKVQRRRKLVQVQCLCMYIWISIQHTHAIAILQNEISVCFKECRHDLRAKAASTPSRCEIAVTRRTSCRHFGPCRKWRKLSDSSQRGYGWTTHLWARPTSWRYLSPSNSWWK